MPFDGLRVLSLESRRASEMETLIRKQGGDAFVAPSVREIPLEDHTDAFRLLEGLEANRFEMLILMTGVGLAFWREVISTLGTAERADNALRRTTLLARGPKPVAVLRSAGLSAQVTVPEPNTWKEILREVERRPERRLAIQEYGRPNGDLLDALRKLPAEVEAFALYRWEMPHDMEPLREAIRRLRERAVDLVLFTSSVQLEHLLLAAAREGAKDEVLRALRSEVAVASVGPVMTEALREHGIEPDLVPASPKMGPLVLIAAQDGGRVAATKRVRS